MESMDDFEYEIIGEMRKIRKLKPTEKDNFAINSMDTLLDAYNNVMGVVVLIHFSITSNSNQLSQPLHLPILHILKLSEMSLATFDL